jgi:glucose/arabinose dehydrogenase
MTIRTPNLSIFLSLLLSISIAPSSFSQETPGAMLLPESALPEYEADIDHAKLIEEADNVVYRKGQELYQMVCHSCHGDLSMPGSIPNSLRFGEGVFQHGNDPYTMYQTITRGWRLMIPQVQLVPSEKYAVIHYIREHFLKTNNPDQYFETDEAYLAGLPKGSSTGPKPSNRKPWSDMDYGPYLIGTFEIADEARREIAYNRARGKADAVDPNANIAQKAIAIRLDPGSGGVSKGSTWLAFEHDTLRIAGAWTGEGFIDWKAINFDSGHVVRPRTIGDIISETADGPGWANPENGSFEDERFVGLDGRRFGPLPRSWARYEGLYQRNGKVAIAYRVGNTKILESHQLLKKGSIARILNVGKSSKDLTLRVANAGSSAKVSGTKSVILKDSEGFITATIPAAATPLNFAIHLGDSQGSLKLSALDLSVFKKGGQTQWPEVQEAPIIRGTQEGPFQWDSYTLPISNPWKSRLRATGVDFTSDGNAAIVTCWEGDVWRVDGITDENASSTQWHRIATGLFQPLGVKLVGDDIYVSCRDQIVKLHDLNGDGETDFYEAFNSDHQVTEHFHEFAMGLQTDDEGNFYYAKSARHARPQLVAHHGTLLKVSADGSKTEILANGFRAANGVCINPDGTFIVTDQEGHWNPMNRINWVEPGNNFYGNMWSYGAPEDSSDSAMEKPLAWVDKQFDRSPSELLWVDSKSWGPLNGKLLNLSYGHGRLEIVPHEFVNGQPQGGLNRLPIPDFPTGTMRGRFHPDNGHLYLCGMSAWGTAQMHQPGGFYRIRKTDVPSYLPIELKAKKDGVEITFSEAIDSESLQAAIQPIVVQTWALERSANYGSKHYDKKTLEVVGATLSRNGKTLKLSIPDIEPVWQMSIQYELTGKDGTPVIGEIQNTIHNLGE